MDESSSVVDLVLEVVDAFDYVFKSFVVVVTLGNDALLVFEWDMEGKALLVDWRELVTEHAVEELSLSLALAREAIGMLLEDSMLWDLDLVLDATKSDFGNWEILVDTSTLVAVDLLSCGINLDGDFHRKVRFWWIVWCIY